MGFIEAYKRLERLCAEMLGRDRPVTAYIEEMKAKGEIYKVELIEEHAGKNEPISFYKQGEFVDVCAGPHIPSTGRVKAFKLTACTGAYWRGNSDNKMLTRVYGISFTKNDDLKAHLEHLEDIKKRDHNKLGREMELFTTVDVIGQGLPLLMPKGTKMIQTLQRWIEDEEEKRGYVRTRTPLMATFTLRMLMATSFTSTVCTTTTARFALTQWRPSP